MTEIPVGGGGGPPRGIQLLATERGVHRNRRRGTTIAMLQGRLGEQGKIDPSETPPSPTITGKRPQEPSSDQPRWWGEPYTIEPQLAKLQRGLGSGPVVAASSWEPMGV